MSILKGIVVVSLVLILQACNTVQGIGQDITQGGRAVERAATGSN